MSQLQLKSYERITLEDLRVLLTKAEEVKKQFFKDNPRYRPYKRNIVAILLCQGAAKHFVDRKNGVKDFDVYFFFGPAKCRYSLKKLGRCRYTRDSALLKFGKHPDFPEFIGRKIDHMIRELDADIVKRFKGNPKACLKAYLNDGRTKTSRELKKKAVIGLYPQEILGKVLWASRE